MSAGMKAAETQLARPGEVQPVSREAMLQALSASFPAMFKRLAEDFSSSYRDQGAIQVGGEAEFDGLPIFPSIFLDSDEYDGYLLIAFKTWVESRGWWVDMHDVQQFLLLPCEPNSFSHKAQL